MPSQKQKIKKYFSWRNGVKLQEDKLIFQILSNYK